MKELVFITLFFVSLILFHCSWLFFPETKTYKDVEHLL